MMLHSLTSSFLWSSFFWFKELKLRQSLCLDNKSRSLCPFQSLSVLDDSNPSSPAADFSGLVVEPNLSGRSHTLTFSSSEVSADQTWRSHRSFACISCIKQAVWKLRYCLVPPALRSYCSCVACVCWWCSLCVFMWLITVVFVLHDREDQTHASCSCSSPVHRNHPTFIHIFYSRCIKLNDACF